MSKLKKKFRNKKKLPALAMSVFTGLIKLMSGLCKITIEDPHGYTELEENFIVTIWHNRMLFMPTVFPEKIRVRTKAVVSASRDGQYVVDVIERFGLQALRGSSSKKGSNAQRGALKAVQENWHVVFTPDGPRGPKYYMHPGPVHLAAVTGKRIAPVAINASRYWQLKSWDKFQIPKPFSKVNVVIGKAIEIPANISNREELEIWRRKAEESLMQVTKD